LINLYPNPNSPQALAFGTDEDISGAEGAEYHTSVFDLSANPTAYYLDQLALAERLKTSAKERSVFDGEPGTRIDLGFRAAESTLLFACKYLTKAIGGYLLDKSAKSSDYAPVSAVPASVQETSLEAILSVLKGEKYYSTASYPLDLKAYAIKANVDECPNPVEGYCYGVEPVSAFARRDTRDQTILDYLLDPARLERRRDQAWSDGVGSLADYLKRLTDELLSAEAAAGNPNVAEYLLTLLLLFHDRTDPGEGFLVSGAVATAAYDALNSVSCADGRMDFVCHRLLREAFSTPFGPDSG